MRPDASPVRMWAARWDRPRLVGRRLVAARTLGVAGAVAYNWWIVVPFVPGLLPSVDGFFSDLAVPGRPWAADMARADIAAGVLLVAALVLRGARSDGRPRPEWGWMLAFALAGTVGGLFPYACSEGLSATCRQQEWSLQLPLHHYVHVLAGIVEFATVTVAAVLARRRTRGSARPVARVHTAVLVALAVGYPLLGAAYLTDRLGAVVEPVFFVAVTAMVLAEVFERRRSRDGGPPDDRAGSVRAVELAGRFRRYAAVPPVASGTTGPLPDGGRCLSPPEG